MRLEHSCCPGKVNIYAPGFVQKESYTLKNDTIECIEWHCLGCGAVVRTYVELKKEKPS
jgi:hypothetical protein